MSGPKIIQRVEFPCPPETVFRAWLDSQQHGAMVGGAAEIEPHEGGRFSIWDGAASGRTLKIDRGNLTITQHWRYAYDDWPEDQPSTITLKFEPVDSQACVLRFSQSGVPSKYFGDVVDGWQQYYWRPMRRYFQKLAKK